MTEKEKHFFQRVKFVKFCGRSSESERENEEVCGFSLLRGDSSRSMRAANTCKSVNEGHLGLLAKPDTLMAMWSCGHMTTYGHMTIQEVLGPALRPHNVIGI